MKEKIFDIIIHRVLKLEGSYVNDENDKGGETKYGISKRTYPELDIKNLSIEDAKKIYKRDFWDNYGYNEITDTDVAFKVLEISVNIGPKNAIKILQRALRALGFDLIDDGDYGSMTSYSVQTVLRSSLDAEKLFVCLKCEQASYYRKIVAKHPTQQCFLEGWLNRAYS